jgi:tetratricopeptide (TPR) repeat protein
MKEMKRLKMKPYIKAEKSYRKALSLAPEKAVALYNLGNTHFLDKKYDEASQRFFQTQKFANSKEDKHRHSIIWEMFICRKKNIKKAVEAYKNALRNNPADEETRYNYALAKELLENEKAPRGTGAGRQERSRPAGSKIKKTSKKKIKTKREIKKTKTNRIKIKKGTRVMNLTRRVSPKNEGDQKKDRNPMSEKGDNPQEKKQPPKQGQLSPQQVQSLLEAMNNQEKKVQDKVNAKKVKGVPVRGKKDW